MLFSAPSDTWCVCSFQQLTTTFDAQERERDRLRVQTAELTAHVAVHQRQLDEAHVQLQVARDEARRGQVSTSSATSRCFVPGEIF